MGVIASLVFVGLEVRQNTLATQAAAIQESVTVAREQIQMYALDGEANRINMIGAQDPDALTEEERVRYRWMGLSFFWGMQGLHRQWELGILPANEWLAWQQVVCINMGWPGMRWVWSTAPFYTPQFRAAVESCETFRTS
jgi:hypothetical protein